MGVSPDAVGPDAAGTEVPAAVRTIADGLPMDLAWLNAIGGRTYEVGTGPDRRFVKWSPAASGIDLAGEATRLSWAGAFTPVPRVLAQGADAAGTWIVTAPVPGRNAVDSRWRADPATAVRAIGEGLRALHEALPVSSCPFSWAARARAGGAVRAAAEGHMDPAVSWHSVHLTLSIDHALEIAHDIPPVDRLVVCHGDACAPNTLLTDDGRWSGHVDLGQLGVADRWADLAVATWSTEWNYGPGWDGLLLDCYGIDPDPERTSYYRLLWDLDP